MVSRHSLFSVALAFLGLGMLFVPYDTIRRIPDKKMNNFRGGTGGCAPQGTMPFVWNGGCQNGVPAGGCDAAPPIGMTCGVGALQCTAECSRDSYYPMFLGLSRNVDLINCPTLDQSQCKLQAGSGKCGCEDPKISYSCATLNPAGFWAVCGTP